MMKKIALRMADLEIACLAEFIESLSGEVIFHLFEDEAEYSALRHALDHVYFKLTGKRLKLGDIEDTSTQY